MYEIFTDRAQKVMALTNQEAQRLSHDYIGTEHILLGLIREGTGVASSVLKDYDFDLRKIRQEIEKLVQPGPDMVTLGRIPQTPRVKKVIGYAMEEARNLNHNYVGTEHILLGLLRENEGVVSQVLMNMGLRLEDTREKTLELVEGNLEDRVGSNYWLAPKNEAGIVRFLKFCNYRVCSEKKPMVISGSDYVIGNLGPENNKLSLTYDVSNSRQVEYVFVLAELLDKNKVEYDEQPPREEVVAALEVSVKSTKDLIGKLKSSG